MKIILLGMMEVPPALGLIVSVENSFLMHCPKSLKSEHKAARPGCSRRGSRLSLTAGVDAGVADRFVFVAGRVFLQFTQDLLHGRLGTSRRSGCVCAGWCASDGAYFKGAEAVATSPNAPG